ncbi:MAG TPA: hypothetical protein VJQ83_08930 [Tepidiformaceae bacterium]|nr:hypothetical protein [Tepidiformaceae bacterium]
MSHLRSVGLIAAVLVLSVLASRPGEALMPNATSSGLITALHAAGPAPDRAVVLSVYGQFVGDWSAKIVAYGPDGARHEGRGEIHFGWVLQGRAIQDVWIIDRRPGAPAMPVTGNWYGTTLRVYDPSLSAWRIYWVDPATNTYRYQVGRAQGRDIVQEGSTESGALSRWSFTEITRRSFHWTGEVSLDKGASWRLVVEVFAQRVPD